MMRSSGVLIFAVNKVVFLLGKELPTLFSICSFCGCLMSFPLELRA